MGGRVIVTPPLFALQGESRLNYAEAPAKS
jgi:hypothetical protein